jgi:hypothetical protein
MAKSLDGVKVLDLTHAYAGPFWHAAAERPSAPKLSRSKGPAPATRSGPKRLSPKATKAERSSI